MNVLLRRLSMALFCAAVIVAGTGGAAARDSQDRGTADVPGNPRISAHGCAHCPKKAALPETSPSQS